MSKIRSEGVSKSWSASFMREIEELGFNARSYESHRSGKFLIEFYIEEENLISFYSYWDLNQYLRGLLKGIRLSRSHVMGRVLELWQR